MVLISKSDKKLWENYISNFEKTNILPRIGNSTYKEDKLKNKVTDKNNKSSSYYSLFKKRGSKPDIVLDLHGHTLFCKINIEQIYNKLL